MIFQQLWLNFATLFLSFKECMIKDNRGQSHEEVIADLHTYLEHLNQKSQEMETRIERCSQKALYHKLQAQQEPTKSGKERENNRAKLFLKDKRRLLDEQDKAMKFTHVIRQQIDSLTTSELDTIMVEAMKQYNMTATQMGLPDRTKEIEDLGADLQERFTEASQLQQILGDATNPSLLSSTLSFGNDDEEDLMLELEALGFNGDPPQAIVSSIPANPPVTQIVEQEARKEEEHEHRQGQVELVSS